MSYEAQIIEWLIADSERMQALETAASLQLDDWCLAAGFVRNLVWDRLHGRHQTTPLNDVDLIYYEPESASKERDSAIEEALRRDSHLPWSVKNQARMHLRNGDQPYTSS